MKVFFVALVCALTIGATASEASAETVTASYYGYELAGSLTASQEVYDPMAWTCAHQSYDFGTVLLVEYGGAAVTCEVTDRGPYVDGRGLDVSLICAQALGLIPAGADAVKVTVIHDP